jgi:Domain of unknown function (DUF4167)
MNMMRKNNNRDNRGGGNRNNRGGSGGGGGARRYSNNSGGGNRSGQNDGQNLQRQKHHATQQLGKYSDMARNAQINGDRVDVEYYLQHVDHYTRVLTDIASIEAERHAHVRESQIIPGGPNDPNAQAQHGGGDASNNAGDSDASATSSESNDGAANSDTGANHSPRPARQPRRQHYSEPQQQDDNGAREANSNTTEIPLPGGILPPI